MSDLIQRVHAALAAYDEAAEAYAEHADDDHASVRDYEDWEDAQLDVLDTFLTFARAMVAPEGEHEGEIPIVVWAKPLGENHIFGLREQFASAVIPEGVVTFDHNFGFAGLHLMAAVTFNDGGGTVQESIPIEPMLNAWIERIVHTHTNKEVSA